MCFQKSNVCITHIKFNKSAMNSCTFLDKKDLIGLKIGATYPEGGLIKRSVIVLLGNAVVLLQFFPDSQYAKEHRHKEDLIFKKEEREEEAEEKEEKCCQPSRFTRTLVIQNPLL